MGIFDFLKKQPEPTPETVVVPEEKPKKPRKPRVKKEKPVAVEKTAKQIATEKMEPWVDVVTVELDPKNIGQGSFEIDWNEYFVAKLIKVGYKGENDEQIIDQWFQDVCRNVVLETYEQEAADPEKRSHINRRDLGNGRTEVS